ncbi:MAG TPA: NAD(P)/FAD-dependent oxidoreductase [archaeon]|nr:NAD(P)/FAD-dependent oxidoreductase [archaeon]
MPYDVIVCGAGPAGCTCALYLANSGLKVLLLEKEKFPRDKVCADNKTWLCTDIVKELGLWDEFEKLKKQPISGVLVGSPAGHEMYTPFLQSDIAQKGPWYNVKRLLFDNMLAQACKGHKNILLREGCKVIGPVVDSDKVIGVNFLDEKGHNSKALSKVVVGSDGSKSAIANVLGISTRVKGRYALNARAYYENVKGPMDRCELYYLKGVCPGYFWIFPVDEKTCNVGIGMRLEDIKKGHVNLEHKLEEIVKSSRFRARFEDSKKVTQVEKWGLSVLGQRRACSGNGFVLCGDAGTFAMTFSGEGVGPSMRSAKIAARAIINAFKRKDFSAKSLSEYDEEIWKILVPEVSGFKWLEFLILHEKIFDFVLSRASKNKSLIELSSRMQRDYSLAREFASPKTILKLLFG